VIKILWQPGEYVV